MSDDLAVQDSVYRVVFEYPAMLFMDKRSLAVLPGFLPSIECVYCGEVLTFEGLSADGITCTNCGRQTTVKEISELTRCAREGLELLDKKIAQQDKVRKQGKGRLCSILRVLRPGRPGAVPQ